MMDTIFQLVIDTVLQGLGKTYGLDWMTMFFGVIGTYLVTKKDKRGIVFNVLSCCTGFSLAIICHQYGFIIYNVILVIIMSRAYASWSTEAKQIAA